MELGHNLYVVSLFLVLYPPGALVMKNCMIIIATHVKASRVHNVNVWDMLLSVYVTEEAGLLGNFLVRGRGSKFECPFNVGVDFSDYLKRVHVHLLKMLNGVDKTPPKYMY